MLQTRKINDVTYLSPPSQMEKTLLGLLRAIVKTTRRVVAVIASSGGPLTTEYE